MPAPIRFPFVADGKVDWPALLGFVVATGVTVAVVLPLAKKAWQKVGG